ncbi:MAG TPA: hypothetical protein VKG65_07120, partial [Terriglobales bacterium]|nr:hypothetical protein [Terriglobales bacterium]
DRRRQAQCNDQSAIQLEIHDDFSSAMVLLQKNLLLSACEYGLVRPIKGIKQLSCHSDFVSGWVSTRQQ